MSYLREVSDWLDGPALIAWLKDNGMETMVELTPSLQRRANEWKRGSQANVYTVDKLLVRLGMHLVDLPDELWIERKIAGRLRPWQLAQLERRIEAGDRNAEIARDFGISSRAVRYHRNRLYGQSTATNHKRPSPAAA